MMRKTETAPILRGHASHRRVQARDMDALLTILPARSTEATQSPFCPTNDWASVAACGVSLARPTAARRPLAPSRLPAERN